MKKLYKQIISLIIILILAIIFFKFIIPLATSLAFMFYTIIKLYSCVDTNTKFLGGCFFLVVSFYLLRALIICMLDVGNYALQYGGFIKNKK